MIIIMMCNWRSNGLLDHEQLRTQCRVVVNFELKFTDGLALRLPIGPAPQLELVNHELEVHPTSAQNLVTGSDLPSIH